MSVQTRPKPDSHDAYLAALPPDQARVLSELRAVIRAYLPDAEECISYAMPAFRLGKVVAGYAAFRAHCGFYPFSGNIIPRLAGELSAWKTSKSGVLFTPDTPLPGTIVRRIIDLRRDEIAGGTTR
ncbi:MAG: DUF1801 domain-containing protein [Rhodobacteraceae bacterium]|nr:DUF1801 domain-containing protein [Paracoccaceae bacterium]